MRRSIAEGDIKAIGFQKEIETLILEQLSLYPEEMSPADIKHYSAFLDKIKAVQVMRSRIISQAEKELNLLSQEIEVLNEEVKEHQKKAIK